MRRGRGRRKGHSGSAEKPDEVHDAWEADGEGAELAAERTASNSGRGRGRGPGHPPKKVGFAKSRLAGRKAADDYIMGDLAYRQRKGGVRQGEEGSH